MHNLRNFCIIAHIDHGKSTLADRFLEVTETIAKRDMKHGQVLDRMDLEQERGITIKLQPVRMEYFYNFQGAGEQKFILNLIDTPGHVDFSYEVSRSLSACEGAILVVDASQGIQAQTMANVFMAMEHDLTLIPVLNKIDLPSADINRCALAIENTLAIPQDEIIAVSAKEGTNIEQVLKAVIDRVPDPSQSGLRTKLQLKNEHELKALIFDSTYDPYKGVVAYIRVISGQVKRGDAVYLLGTKKKIEVLEVGYFKPDYKPAEILLPGEVGYIVTGLKSVREARVGDTIWANLTLGKDLKPENIKPLPGYKKVQPMVFAGIFCTEGDDFPLLRDALEKLSLNDSALTFTAEQSPALGFGFRCGFLGLLHLDIVQERLEREYDLSLIVTAPSVSYELYFQGSDHDKIRKNTGLDPDENMKIIISNPSDLPDRTYIKEAREPWVKMEIITPKDQVGAIMKVVDDRRGVYKNMNYLEEQRVFLHFEIPLSSIVIDFYDVLKSISSGYASMNYEFLDYRAGDLVKLDILIAGDKIDALSSIIHKSESFFLGSKIVKKLKEIIPRTQFAIALQAAIGGKIIARETIPAFRKDVTAKLYGGDRTRKDKLLKKQKEGKKRMKQMGNVHIPQEAFLSILKRD
jgi:GTP-binding protein LepA